MLVIRNERMAVFQAAARRAFEDEMVAPEILTDRDSSGVALVVVLMLVFGHGCRADPFYPWIARALPDERITDPEARAKRLETKTLTWLERVLAYFAKRGRMHELPKRPSSS